MEQLGLISLCNRERSREESREKQVSCAISRASGDKALVVSIHGKIFGFYDKVFQSFQITGLNMSCFELLWKY